MTQTKRARSHLPRLAKDCLQLAELSFAIAAAVAVLTACSDPKAATRANFEAALTPVVESQCALVPLPRFDAAVHVEGTTTYEFSSWIPLRKADADALTFAQLIQGDADRSVRPAPGSTQRIELTPAATRDLRVLQGHHALCVADLRFKAVTSWTEPADSMGQRISLVTVEVEPIRRRTWASSAAMRERFPEIASYDAVSKEARVVMVLTNTGWAPRSTPVLNF